MGRNKGWTRQLSLVRGDTQPRLYTGTGSPVQRCPKARPEGTRPGPDSRVQYPLWTGSDGVRQDRGQMTEEGEGARSNWLQLVPQPGLLAGRWAADKGTRLSDLCPSQN